MDIGTGAHTKSSWNNIFLYVLENIKIETVSF